MSMRTDKDGLKYKSPRYEVSHSLKWNGDDQIDYEVTLTTNDLELAKKECARLFREKLENIMIVDSRTGEEI
jgi:hypothetical protein